MIDGIEVEFLSVLASCFVVSLMTNGVALHLKKFDCINFPLLVDFWGFGIMSALFQVLWIPVYRQFSFCCFSSCFYVQSIS